MITQNEKNGIVEHNGGRIDNPPTDPSISENIVQIVWRGRWIVLVFMVVSVALAAFYLAKATPIYTSTARIYVEQRGPEILRENEDGVMTQSKNYLYTQAELLRSRKVLSAALKNAQLKDLKVFEGVDNPVLFLKEKGLEIDVGAKDDIISISSDSPSSVQASQLVNAVVEAYIAYNASTKRSTSAEILAILQKERDERNDELSAKLKEMMDFKRQHDSLAFESSQGNVILQRLEQLATELGRAQLETLDAKAAYDSTQAMVSNPARFSRYVEAQQSRSIGGSTVERTKLNTTLDNLESKLADRLRQLKPDHPAVEALRTEIEQVEAEIAEIDQALAEAYLASAREDYEAAQMKEAELAKYYEEQRKAAIMLNEKKAQLTVLQNEWEQVKQYCDLLDQRIKELNITEDTGALNISILEPAEPTDKPSSPKRGMTLGLAVLLGLVAGCGFAVARNFVDQRLRSAEEISAVLGVPMLGTVPTMSKKLTVSARGKKVHVDPTSPVAEAYRTVRTAVFFSVPKGQAETVLITSPSAGDGKSTLVSNLGIAMAQAGQRVLIVDADFRKPMQHAIFESNQDPGVSSILAGTATLEEALKRTGVPGLDVLACGPDVPNPSEILNSDEFISLMEKLSERYDRVLVDAPPVMPVTDACILGAICDVTLLVLRAEKSTRKTAQQARDGLLSVGARILGTVVNDVARRKGRYGYYYGQYSYGYGRKNKKNAEIDNNVVATART